MKEIINKKKDKDTVKKKKRTEVETKDIRYNQR